jgi:metal-sulfur cluster biosynthetic enzyme
VSETDVATATDPAVAPAEETAATTGIAAATVAETAAAAATSAVAVAAEDAAASETGEAPAADTAPSSAPGAVVKKASLEDVEEAMKDVVDPELGINVVDLGLVYGAHVDDDNVATLDMTLTSAACPLTDVIEDQARAALCTGPGGGLVNDLRINWVWLPPWGPDKITDEGRDQLRALGFNV